MILNVCTDDRALSLAAQQDAANHPGVFGAYQSVNDRPRVKLKTNEDLFITGHGEASDPRHDNPTIGDEDTSGLTFTPVSLAELVAEYAPKGYTGRVFISACGADDLNKYTLMSLAEGFRDRLVSHDTLKAVRQVFSARGAVDYSIPLPSDDRAWHQVWVRV